MVKESQSRGMGSGRGTGSDVAALLSLKAFLFFGFFLLAVVTFSPPAPILSSNCDQLY